MCKWIHFESNGALNFGVWCPLEFFSNRSLSQGTFQQSSVVQVHVDSRRLRPGKNKRKKHVKKSPRKRLKQHETTWNNMKKHNKLQQTQINLINFSWASLTEDPRVSNCPQNKCLCFILILLKCLATHLNHLLTSKSVLSKKINPRFRVLHTSNTICLNSWVQIDQNYRILTALKIPYLLQEVVTVVPYLSLLRTRMHFPIRFLSISWIALDILWYLRCSLWSLGSIGFFSQQCNNAKCIGFFLCSGHRIAASVEPATLRHRCEMWEAEWGLTKDI